MVIVPIFFFFLSLPITENSGRDTRDFYLMSATRASREEFLVLSRYRQRPGYNPAIKFVIEFIFPRFIADASDSRAGWRVKFLDSLKNDQRGEHLSGALVSRIIIIIVE